MSTVSKKFLSGSTNGQPVKVVATATPGTLIHTAVTGTTDMDELWLYAVNSDPSTIKLTIELGGTTAPDNLIEVSLAGESGLVLIVPGLPINNSLLVRAFADSASLLNIVGFVNRITG